MTKTSRARKKTTKIGNFQARPSRPAGKSIELQAAQTAVRAQAVASDSQAARRFVKPAAGAIGSQTLVFPAMVALGCWGMAFTLAYFYTDPNRFLFAGMAALMGLFWTYSFYARLRRMRKTRLNNAIK